MRTGGHIHAAASKFNALHFEPGSLVKRSFERGLYVAASANDAMPRKAVPRTIEHLRHLPVVTGIAGGFRHFAVG